MKVEDSQPAKSTLRSLEYGICSFVYRARRPFHPKRLGELCTSHFVLQEECIELEVEGGGEEDSKQGEDEEEEEEGGEEEEEDEEEGEGGEEEEEDEEEGDWREEKVTQKKSGPFRDVMRSKGTVWLASRHDMMGGWSQAGIVLSFKFGGPWFINIPEDQWPKTSIDLIESDMDKDVGDRRQELVFIGVDVDQAAVSAALDSALLTDEEMVEYQKGKRDFEDPFETWPTLKDIVGGMDNENEAEACPLAQQPGAGAGAGAKKPKRPREDLSSGAVKEEALPRKTRSRS